MKVSSKKVARVINKTIRIINTIVVISVVSTLVISLFLNYWFSTNLNSLTESYSQYQKYHIQYRQEAEKEIDELDTKVTELTQRSKEMLERMYVETMGYEIFKVTSYSPNDPNDAIQQTTNTTSIGFKVDRPYMDYINICAVDPQVIPYGSIIFVVFELGSEKIYIAGDCGALVIGDHIDLMVATKEEALEFGTRHLPVKVIKAGDFLR